MRRNPGDEARTAMQRYLIMSGELIRIVDLSPADADGMRRAGWVVKPLAPEGTGPHRPAGARGTTAREQFKNRLVAELRRLYSEQI